MTSAPENWPPGWQEPQRRPKYEATIEPAGDRSLHIPVSGMHDLRIGRGNADTLFVMDVTELAGLRDKVSAYLRGLPDA